MNQRQSVPAADEILGLYFPVLDHGFVSLVDYMGGDLAIERAARTSFVVEEESRSLKDTRDLLRYLMRHRHTSPFEMAELKFHVAMPLVVARQLVRHRTLNWNEFSGRYAEMPTLFYMPDRDQVCVQSKTNKQGGAEPISNEGYEDFIDGLSGIRQLSKEFYREALGRGVARETARVDLPLSTYTYVVIKGDLHNLLHLVKLRSDSHAQWEIRQYSDVIAGMIKRVAPISFEAFLDYQFDGVAFSRMEVEAIRNTISMLEEGGRMDPKKLLGSLLAAAGTTNRREHDEFLSKLERRDRPSFELDPPTAKPAAYFMDNIKEALK